MDFDERIIYLVMLKNKALDNGDAVRYARLCDDLGLLPENDVLYQNGRDLIEIESGKYLNLRQEPQVVRHVEKKVKLKKRKRDRRDELGSEGWFD